MLINLNNSATKTIPTSDLICPLILWILMSAAFVTFALAEYFAILVLLRFGNKVGEIEVDTAILISGIFLVFKSIDEGPSFKVGAEVGAYKETKTKWPKEKSGSEIQGEKARMYFFLLQ